MTEQFPMRPLPVVHPQKKSSRAWQVVGGLVLTAVGFGIGASASGHPATGATPAPTVTRTIKPAVAAPTTPVATKTVVATVKAKVSFGDGAWLVGRDVKPGTYTTVDEVAGSCYWERHNLKNNGIIANGLVEGGHPTVTVRNGEEFRTRECGDWRAA
jgi:hypothetical protein